MPTAYFYASSGESGHEGRSENHSSVGVGEEDHQNNNPLEERGRRPGGLRTFPGFCCFSSIMFLLMFTLFFGAISGLFQISGISKKTNESVIIPIITTTTAEEIPSLEELARWDEASLDCIHYQWPPHFFDSKKPDHIGTYCGGCAHPLIPKYNNRIPKKIISYHCQKCCGPKYAEGTEKMEKCMEACKVEFVRIVKAQRKDE